MEAMVTAMMNLLLAWMVAGVAGLAFAGFLFGLSAALTYMARRDRSAQARVAERVGSHPRLWAQG
jgi:hypothetical protein